MNASDLVHLCEVGLRDGLQILSGFFPTSEKIRWLEAEAAAGMPEIEVTSFVPEKLVPQFKDAEQVVHAALSIAGLTVSALVPNSRGAQRGLELGLHKLDFVMSVSRTHNLKNVRREREDSVADFKRIIDMRNQHPKGRQTKVIGGLSTSFGCSYEGRINPDDVTRYALMLAEAGADGLIIADTVGYADPAMVKRVFNHVMKEVGSLPVKAHFHDTRGTGLANAAAALDCGIREFDASLAGLGGCPFAPGASGNVVMEDLCFMLDSMGFRTNVDLHKLLKVREILMPEIEPSELRGAIAKAGLPTNYLPGSAR